MKAFQRVHKYRAKPTNGYASKREAAYADLLLTLKQAGQIIDWLEQVPIKLPGNNKYVVDFMVLDSTGVRFIEVKGFMTPSFKIKLKLLAESRPEIYNRLEIVK